MTRAFLSWGPLLLLSLGLGFFNAAYAASRSPTAFSAATILVNILPFFIIFWVMQDARRRRCVPCFDIGFLLGVTFPLGVIWYLFWTRGWKGFALLAVFLTLFVAPWVFGVFVLVMTATMRR